jgi:protein TonB
LLVHGAVLAGLIILAYHAPQLAEPPPDQEPTVELVLDKGTLPGAAQPPHSAPEPAAPAPTPAPARTEASEAVPPPPVVPPAPPAPRAEEAPTISIGGANSDTNTILRAMGPYVTPATPDSKYLNRKPNYPDAAIAQAAEGAVDLLIHVSADGLVTGADILESSGYRSLDEAARDAARSWHFLPAVKDGQPVPFDMPFRIMFQLDRR